MTDIAHAATQPVAVGSRSARTKTRRRFLVLSIAVLAILATVLGVSFTADTGVTSVTAATTGGTSSLVYTPTYGTAGGLPTALDTVGWKDAAGAAPTTPVSPTLPTIVAGTAATVSTSGDVAVIDATDTSSSYLLVTVYVTNMQALGLTYNSYSLPVRLYAVSYDSGTSAYSWPSSPATDANGVDTSSTYLTNTAGYETFKLATGANKYYEITLDSGGSLYPYQTGATDADTSPTFYVTAQRSS